MKPPRVYTCSPSWTRLSPPFPYHPSGSSQCTSPKHPVSCIEPVLVINFLYDIKHVTMPFSQIIPPSPSPTESKRLFYISVSLLLSCIQGYRYHLSKFHIYELIYCIGVFSFWLTSLCIISSSFIHLIRTDSNVFFLIYLHCSQTWLYTLVSFFLFQFFFQSWSTCPRGVSTGIDSVWPILDPNLGRCLWFWN